MKRKRVIDRGEIVSIGLTKNDEIMVEFIGFKSGFPERIFLTKGNCEIISILYGIISETKENAL